MNNFTRKLFLSFALLLLLTSCTNTPTSEEKIRSICINNNSPEESILCLESFIKNEPNNTVAYKILISRYKIKKETTKCIELLNKLKEIAPDDPTTYKDLGDNYLLLKQYNLAIESYEKSISLDPSQDSIYYILAVVNVTIGNKSKAKEYYTKVKKLKPTMTNSID